MVMSVLTVPFSIFFHIAYKVEPYYLENVNRNGPIAHNDVEAGSTNLSERSGPEGPYVSISTAGTSYQGGFLGIRAWLGMLNPSELISGFIFGLTMLDKAKRETDL